MGTAVLGSHSVNTHTALRAKGGIREHLLAVWPNILLPSWAADCRAVAKGIGANRPERHQHTVPVICSIAVGLGQHCCGVLVARSGASGWEGVGPAGVQTVAKRYACMLQLAACTQAHSVEVSYVNGGKCDNAPGAGHLHMCACNKAGPSYQGTPGSTVALAVHVNTRLTPLVPVCVQVTAYRHDSLLEQKGACTASRSCHILCKTQLLLCVFC